VSTLLLLLYHFNADVNQWSCFWCWNRELVCCSGHIQSRVVYYLMNIRVLPRTIYVARVSLSDALLIQQ